MNNYLSNNEFGILLINSGSNYIIDNNIKDGMAGVFLLNYSNSNTITDNNIKDSMLGVTLNYANSNTITDNNINDNGMGIGLFNYSNSNTITDNNIKDNMIGVSLNNYSNTNTITGNNINNNGIWGIHSENTIDNKIYLNNFRDSFLNVKSDNSTDFWYLTEKITYTYNGRICSHYLGNYWSDYKGSDADGDGIGDSPYPIDADNDKYPLIEPFENYKIEHPPLAILASTKECCDQYKTGENRDEYGYNELLEIQKIIGTFNKSLFEP